MSIHLNTQVGVSKYNLGFSLLYVFPCIFILNYIYIFKALQIYAVNISKLRITFRKISGAGESPHVTNIIT